MKLSSSDIFKLVAEFVREDVGRGDITSEAIAPNSVTGKGKFIADEPFVLAGLEIADAVFAVLDAQVEIEAFAADGDLIQKDQCFARVSGPAEVLLTGERVALNLLRHLSGIATMTRRYVDAVKGTNTMVMDTRRTTPGLRVLERFAVLLGGGQNYRMGLDDGVLIQNNHAALIGGFKECIERVRQSGLDCLHRIEVEVSNRTDLSEAVAAGADTIFFTQVTPEQVRPMIEWARAERPDILLGVSGDVALEQAGAYAATGIDLLAVGTLTDAVRSASISFKISTK